jgi:hypothetical protein
MTAAMVSGALLPVVIIFRGKIVCQKRRDAGDALRLPTDMGPKAR